MKQEKDLNSPSDIRAACRAGLWTKPTAGMAPGYLQVNLVVLPGDWAQEFEEFCRKNPKPCPLIEVTGPGSKTPQRSAPNSDLSKDLPRYRIWKESKWLDETTDVERYWQSDFQAFLLGCSFTFDSALQKESLPVRHVESGVNVPMFRTKIACEPAGRFKGNLVVSMRPMTPEQAEQARAVSEKYPFAHGTPVHHGDPLQIGIKEIECPDFGQAVEIKTGEIPVFWACGVTPQTAIESACPPLAITHAPGNMFVTDIREEDLISRKP